MNEIDLVKMKKKLALKTGTLDSAIQKIGADKAALDAKEKALAAEKDTLKADAEAIAAAFAAADRQGIVLKIADPTPPGEKVKKPKETKVEKADTDPSLPPHITLGTPRKKRDVKKRGYSTCRVYASLSMSEQIELFMFAVLNAGATWTLEYLSNFGFIKFNSNLDGSNDEIDGIVSRDRVRADVRTNILAVIWMFGALTAAPEDMRIVERIERTNDYRLTVIGKRLARLALPNRFSFIKRAAMAHVCLFTDGAYAGDKTPKLGKGHHFYEIHEMAVKRMSAQIAKLNNFAKARKILVDAPGACLEDGFVRVSTNNA
jgi:hypothetical protein